MQDAESSVSINISGIDGDDNDGGGSSSGGDADGRPPLCAKAAFISRNFPLCLTALIFSLPFCVRVNCSVSPIQIRSSAKTPAAAAAAAAARCDNRPESCDHHSLLFTSHLRSSNQSSSWLTFGSTWGQSIGSKMEAARERLQRLKELRKQASHANYKEVLEENEKAKRPANWEKKIELYQKKLDNETSDPDKKLLNMQVDQVERWEKPKVEKALKPMSSKDCKEGVDRMVEDVQKKIELRGKRSRRRRFDHDADVDYINERNMKFNKKLERFYGNYTDEIKQNFERGTAI